MDENFKNDNMENQNDGMYQTNITGENQQENETAQADMTGSGDTFSQETGDGYDQTNMDNQSGFYHGTPNQGMYFGGAFYSSNQHAGYNSQTGYTSAYSNGGPVNQQQDASGYTQYTENGYGGMASDNVDKAAKKAAEKEAKKSAKMVKTAKKKAEKKFRKETKRQKNGGRSTGNKIAITIAAAVIFGLVAGCVFQGVRYGTDLFLEKDKKTTATMESNTDTPVISANSSESGTSVQYDVADVSEKVMPSIVSLTGTYVTTYQYWFNSYEEESAGAGSGIIIGKDENDLYILTNYHVVENAKELSAGFIDGESVEAEVKGYDESNDVAIVTVSIKKIKDDTLSQIKEISIGSSDDLRIGDPCIAIGNALGYGQSVTVGYISALDREVSVDDGTVTVLQIDAAINPGNSGGALVNMKGELIGVNTAKYVDSTVEGIGYALPISNIQDIINDILAGKSTTSTGSVYLGVTVKNITSEYSEGLNMPEGVYVYSVSENSPAEKCGLLTGDIIVGINGKEITDSTELQNEIADNDAGDKIEIEFYRNEKGEYVKKTVEATLEEKL